MKKGKRFFYGWIIVMASIIILGVAIGMMSSTNGLFVKPVSDSLGFTRSQFSVYRTIVILISACTVPFYGKIIQRIGIKKISLIGAAVISFVTIGYSFANSLWHFYFLAFINGVFYNSVHFMIIAILVSHWFEEKKGFALGLAYSGSGIGGAIMTPIISNIIETWGWRFAYKFMGVLGFAIMIPVIILFIKETPEESGFKPYVSLKHKKDNNEKIKSLEVNLTLEETLKTSRFWLLIVGLFLTTFLVGAINTHSTAYLSDLGYSMETASAIFSLFMISLTVGKIILGIIYDRFGTMAGNLFIAICSLIFPASAILSYIPIFSIIYAVSAGMASCGATVPITLLITKYFGVNDYPAIFSIFTMLTTLGSAISVPIMGAVYDYLGSYKLAWIGFMFISIIISGCLVSAEISYRNNRDKDLNTRILGEVCK